MPTHVNEKSDHLAPIHERDTPKSIGLNVSHEIPSVGKKKRTTPRSFQAPNAVPDVSLLAILFILRNQQPGAKRTKLFRLFLSFPLSLLLPPPFSFYLFISLARPFGAIWH